MKTIIIWLLITISPVGDYTIMADFPSAESCVQTANALSSQNLVKTKCIPSTLTLTQS